MAESILTQGADMLGQLEWLVANLKKMGAPTKSEEVEGLSKRLDRICARLERLDAVGQSEKEDIEEGTRGAQPEGIADLGAGLLESVSQVSDQIRHMTRENVVCSGEDIERLSRLMDALESEIGDGGPELDPVSKW